MSQLLFIAHPRAMRRRTLLATTVVVGLALGHTLGVPTDAAAQSASLSGVVFEDLDEDGVHDPGEPVWDGQVVEVWTPDESSMLAKGTTDTTGAYRIEGLTPGTYVVKPNGSQWLNYSRSYDWHPEVLYITTNRWGYAADLVDLSGETTFNLGWGEVTFHQVESEPMSEATSARGTQVRSYVDAADATTIAAAIDGLLQGGEASLTTVNFGLYDGMSTCGSSVAGSPGTYTSFSATCNVSYDAWRTGRHATLAHEYGHAWAEYHDHVVQQDGEYTGYLAARGLTGDDRLGSERKWTVGELIAEDYRALFGGFFAARDHMNSEIPPPDEVAGLYEYLSGEWMTGGSTSAVAADEPTTDPTEEPTTAPTDEPTAEPTTDPTAEPTEEPTTDPTQETTHETTAEPAAETSLSLAAGSTNMKGSWEAWVDVTVVVDGAPAEGTTVTAAWQGSGKHGKSGEVSCLVSATGTCTVAVPLENRVPSVTFEVRSEAGSTTVEVLKP